MSRPLPPAGDYTAKCNGQIKITEAKTGTLGVAIPYRLTDSEIPFSDVHTVYIAKSDGSLLAANIDNLKKVFGWDGQDPWSLMWDNPADETGPKDFTSVEFKLSDCKHEDFETEGGKTITSFKPSWLNPIDGGRTLELANRDTVMKKWGSKFRANSGGASKPAATTKAAAKTEPAKSGLPKRPAKPAATPCTPDDAFAALLAKHPGKTMAANEAELGDLFYAKIEELWPGLDPEKLTRQQAGELKAAFEAA